MTDHYKFVTKWPPKVARGRGRLESVEVEELAASADALIGRAALRVEATAVAALNAGDVDGAYVAAYDAYRMAAESLLVRQGCGPVLATASG